MRNHHADILCCPQCHGDFELTVLREAQGDIDEGILRCAPCNRIYPITNGIPRILPNALSSAPEFCRTHAAVLAAMGFESDSREIRRFEKLHKKTARAFGFEWNTYQVTTPEEDIVTLAGLTGFDPAFYSKVFFADIFTHVPQEEDVRAIDASSIKGRTVIEMGCGMGKYVKTVARHAALAVGLDLSHSLERARENTRDLPNVLLVQGNILEPPFRPGTFDYVYSVGVLHHTPDCRLAFKRSAALVVPGGRFSVWLYPTERQSGLYARTVHFVQDDLIRPVTCRMPPSWLYQICRLLGKMTFWRDAAARDGRVALAKFYALFAVGGHTEPKIAEFLNFDWYSPQYRSYHSEEELLRWFPEEGFGNVTILPMRTSGIAFKPRPGETLPLHAPASLHGALDAPRGETSVVSGEDLLVQGWAFDVSGHSTQVEILVDGRKVKEQQCFEARVDVKRHFPSVPHALYCGFHCSIRVPRTSAPAVTVTLRAKSAACPPVTIGEQKVMVGRVPLVRRVARRLRRAARAVRAAFRRRSAGPDPDSDSERALYRKWISLNEGDVPRPHRCDPADPLISIVVPVHETRPDFLRELLASIAAQTCERWQLCAVDDGSATLEPWRMLEAFAAQHPAQVSLKRREQAGGIARASNDALALATGDYIAFCDHDDVLRSDAVAILSETLRANPGVDVVYSDHDILEPDGVRSEPRLKPGWSPDLLRSYMYWGHIKCYRAALIRELGGLRAEFRGAEDYDLALRVAERTQRIVHVPEVLYHWRRHPQSTSSGGTQKQYSIDSGLAALQEHLDRSGIEADASWPELSRRAGVGVFRLDFRYSSFPSVAVVIPTRDRLELLSRCVSTLEETTDYPALEIIIVDNDSAKAETLEYLRRSRHRVIRSPGSFNFSGLMNSAARQTDAEFLLFLNNDTEIIEADWLKRMVGFARLPNVGAVGAKLLYPDQRIQHLGVVMGHEALTGHYFQGEWNEADVMGPLCYKRAVRNVAAVTAACLITPRKLFLETGGFDEVELPVAWNDVDYCLRLLQKGYRVIVDPDVVLIHHEGVSRGEEKNEREIATMFGRWRPIIEADPFYHPGFARTGRSFALRGESAEVEFPRLYYARYAGSADTAARAESRHRAA